MTRRERIAHVCGDRGIDITGTKGAAVHLRSLAAAFSDRVDVTVHVARAPGGDTSIFPFDVRRFRTDDDLVAAVGASRPSAVYERYSLGATAGLRAARQLGVPFVLEVNAPLVAEATAYRPDTVDDTSVEVESMLLAEADLVVAVSGPLRDHLQPSRNGKPTIVVPNGCDPTLFGTAVPRRALPTIGFLGHPKPWHGAGRLVGVLEAVRSRGIDARLLVVGGGDGAALIAADAAERGLDEYVEITGAVDQAAAATTIASAWVGVAPYEPHDFFYFCPLKVVEYMAAGLPVVASDLGDIPHLLDATGVVVAPDDHHGLVDAIVDLLLDRPRADRLGTAARSKALGELTWTDAAVRTLEAITRLSGGRVPTT